MTCHLFSCQMRGRVCTTSRKLGINSFFSYAYKTEFFHLPKTFFLSNFDLPQYPCHYKSSRDRILWYLISLQVRFLSPIYHLNVSPSTGHVCLGFLSEEDWLPTRCIRDVLSAVFSLLIKPEPENSAEQALLQAYNHNRASYEEKARRSAKSFR